MALYAGSAAAGDAEATGARLAHSLEGLHQDDTVQFWEPLEVAGQSFTQATVLHSFGTGSQARLLQMSPGGQLFICKLKDLRREHAVMCALRRMNLRWREKSVCVLGEPVEAVTYGIHPLGSSAGLVEFVSGSSTLVELAERCSVGERHLRVLRYLNCDPGRLCRLAASTAAHLTMGYALGIRDSHDDNLMLRADGAFFRVDFEFAFGATPEVDAPAVFVPRAVSFALGSRRWAAVVDACRRALQALSGDDARTVGFLSAVAEQRPPAGPQHEGRPPAWDLLRSVPELSPMLAEAHAHAKSLSFEAFERDVQQADQWSLSRAAKNTFREAVRYISRELQAAKCTAVETPGGREKKDREGLSLLVGVSPPKEPRAFDVL